MVIEVEDEYGEWEPKLEPQTFTGKLSSPLEEKIKLIASRLGGDHDGREYTIRLKVSDMAGNLAEAEMIVIVPHDQGSEKQ